MPTQQSVSVDALQHHRYVHYGRVMDVKHLLIHVGAPLCTVAIQLSTNLRICSVCVQQPHATYTPGTQTNFPSLVLLSRLTSAMGKCVLGSMLVGHTLVAPKCCGLWCSGEFLIVALIYMYTMLIHTVQIMYTQVYVVFAFSAF